MKHKLLIDTDPGVDDALAILMAMRHPDAEIVALTIAATSKANGFLLGILS